MTEIELGPKSVIFSDVPKATGLADRTGEVAVEIARLKLLIAGVENAAHNADGGITNYILIAVTQGRSYPYLHDKLGMPCSRDYFYIRYRKFFWLLDKL